MEVKPLKSHVSFTSGPIIFNGVGSGGGDEVRKRGRISGGIPPQPVFLIRQVTHLGLKPQHQQFISLPYGVFKSSVPLCYQLNTGCKSGAGNGSGSGWYWSSRWRACRQRASGRSRNTRRCAGDEAKGD